MPLKAARSQARTLNPLETDPMRGLRRLCECRPAPRLQRHEGAGPQALLHPRLHHLDTQAAYGTCNHRMAWLGWMDGLCVTHRKSDDPWGGWRLGPGLPKGAAPRASGVSRPAGSTALPTGPSMGSSAGARQAGARVQATPKCSRESSGLPGLQGPGCYDQAIIGNWLLLEELLEAGHELAGLAAAVGCTHL